VARGGSGAKAPPFAARPEEVPVTSLTYSNIETRMNRPKSVVRVIMGSIVDRPWQPSFREQVLSFTESATSEYSIMSHCLSALLGRRGRVMFVLDGLTWKKINQRTYYSHTNTAR